MSGRENYLGIDIGSVSVALALINGQKQIIYSSYKIHKGQPVECFSNILQEIDLSGIRSIGYTSSGPQIVRQGSSVDTRIAYISAARHLHPGMDALLIIGAEKFGLATFDKSGNYLNYRSNTSCAAGTGNFLDQQAERLNLSSIEEFSRIAHANKGNFPLIASRCAVFAKTDLIHAQQEGYSLAEICDGLSYGLARNIVDAVFGKESFTCLVASGGVSLNKAVVAHIEKLTGNPVLVDEYAHVYGAMGAAINSMEDTRYDQLIITNPEDVIISEITEKSYFFPPLKLELSDYPDFKSMDSYDFQSIEYPGSKAVEVDIYESLHEISDENKRVEKNVYLGIDIGSTSTKAVLLGMDKKVIAGLYTRTSGQPLRAIQTIFEAITDMETRSGVGFVVAAAGTTGSGRKFAGAIIGADAIPDEITAHARAAFELDPETDTIIEIGGQDSKFTLMRNGMVTFSVMNNVCAAGTGSFIEEQAKRLGCRMTEISERAENVPAPLASDRCTVFMERDLNHYLSTGYSAEEILAAVLYSTRENYLSKVALMGSFGNKIFFQGATAKNKALVAAFEQKLKKPILVSKFCHLTGALGTALELHDNNVHSTLFRGLQLYKQNIPVRSEICELCTNHCKLRIAEIGDEVEAYGFLCGRDYNVQKFVKNKTNGFQLTETHNEIFRFRAEKKLTGITIGIPSTLHIAEELPFWRKFFDLLSIRTICSSDYKTAVKDGKNLWNAEFCSPIAALHGHVDYLMKKADFVFLPVYLEDQEQAKETKQYCYYTQYASSVIGVHKHFQHGKKILSPLLRSSRGKIFVRRELLRMLKSAGFDNISIVQLSIAYYNAQKYAQELREKWQAVYKKERTEIDSIHIMLLGRSYTVLSQTMNNHIPEIIEKNGIKAFYMDMMSFDQNKELRTQELIKEIKWKYAAKVLEATEHIAKTKNCYPVLVTSFKCTPDSFVIEYFKDIMNSYGKPYLILQLDELDSTVGYETRIEAGIRAFRNHFARLGKQDIAAEAKSDSNTGYEDNNEEGGINGSWERYKRLLIKQVSKTLKVKSADLKQFTTELQYAGEPEKDFSFPLINVASEIKNKTLLLPAWDSYVGPLIEAVLKNAGVDARLVESSHESMQRSLTSNTGQCLPLNIVLQDYIDYIEKHELNPANTVMWTIKSVLSCNLGMFPQYMKKLLKDHGKGMEQASVYPGDITFYDFSLSIAINAYLAYMFGGNIRKIACMLHPYEKVPGSTDKVLIWASGLLYDMFLHGKNKEKVLDKIIKAFEGIEIEKVQRPKVAIFGDLYVRDNEMMNQDLIRFIEDNGGEAVTTSYSEYIKIIVEPTTERLYMEGRYVVYAFRLFHKSLIPLIEGKFNKYFYRILKEPRIPKGEETDEWLDKFGLNILHRGESLENILKIQTLMINNPDLDLLVQTSPSYCCPSLVTEAMIKRIEELTGIPVINIEYDGTTGNKNEVVIPYLKYRKKRLA